MKRSAAWTSITLLLIIALNGMAQNIERAPQRIDSLFAHYTLETPGVAVAIVKDGKVVLTKTYGSANLEFGIPITTETVFQTASLSKQFTAYAIYLLERQGKLSFDEDIRKYFPKMPFYGKVITIRHLLAHSSGVRDLWGMLSLAGWQMEDVITTEQILKTTMKQKQLNFEPGSAFGYINTGYLLLALIAEQVTGQSFPEFTKQNIFDPLQMTNTQFNNDYKQIVKNRADSYDKVDRKYINQRLNYSAAGPTSLLTTIEDLAKWAMYLNNPKAEDAQLIAAYNEVSMLDNNKPVVWAAREGDTTYHAKGQLQWRYKGLNVISHGGHIAAFRSGLMRVPESNFAVMALSNDEYYDILGNNCKMLEFYLKDKLKEPETRSTPPVQTSKTTEKYLGNIADFTGEYYSDELSTLYSVTERDGILVMTHHRLSDIKLTRIGENKFSGTNSFGFELEFIRSRKKITEFKISNFGAKNVRFKKAIHQY